MPTDPPTPVSATSVAHLILPTVHDLWGHGWTAEPEDEPDGGDGDLVVGTDRCLPEDYPDDDAVADAEVTFERDGALVHAVATVFDGIPAAARAWTIVAGESFARCFADSVAAEVDLPADAHLLGPLSQPGTLALERHGRRTATHRATWARAGQDGVLPVALDLAVVQCGRALVVAWGVDQDRDAAEPGWSRLVDRIERRSEVALALG